MPVGAIIGGVGAIGSALIGSSATSDAANAQQQSSAAALAQNEQQFNRTQANEAPWLAAGGGALGRLSSLYALNPPSGAGTGTGTGTGTGAGGTGGSSANPAQASYDANAHGGLPANNPAVPPGADFYLSPDYNFTLNRGLSGLTAQGAAGSGTDNGATRKSEISFAGNLAAGQYQNYKNTLLNLAGLGGTANGQAATTGQENANANSTILTNQGNNLASSYLGQGGIAQKGLTDLAGQATQYLNGQSVDPISVGSINSVPLTNQPIAGLGGF